MRKLDPASLKFNADGLVPVIAQDATTKQVLMMAWSNAETLAESIELNQMVYFSRSRGARWHKGDTSGNYQNIVGLYQDCDGDTVLALVNPVGPACHNNTTSCFEEA